MISVNISVVKKSQFHFMSIGKWINGTVEEVVIRIRDPLELIAVNE